NVYAQDNELAWIDWSTADTSLVEFVGSLARLRREHPTFRRTRYFDGRPVRRGKSDPLPDVEWLRPDGTAMDESDWESGFGRVVGVYLNGHGIRGRDARGERITDVNFLVYFSAHTEPIELTLPPAEYGARWERLVDTSGLGDTAAVIEAGSSMQLEAISLVVLREHVEAEHTVDDAVSLSLSPAPIEVIGTPAVTPA
ncbi:MAG TPA: glycogen debranching enzyme, partial [Agrococcus sp.]|nr:glycogen debranching enzyme [Agrococcus sp.]